MGTYFVNNQIGAKLTIIQQISTLIRYTAEPYLLNAT